MKETLLCDKTKMIELEKAVKIICEEILTNRSEFKNCIEASETRLQLKIEELKNTATKLEKENSKLKEERHLSNWEIGKLSHKNSNLKEKEIQKNCNKLKGKNISIADDLTAEQRTENKIFRKHLPFARQGGSYGECFIRGNELLVDGVSYGIEDLEETDHLENKPNNAPPTPKTVESIMRIPSEPQAYPSTPKIPDTKKPGHPTPNF
ncbi:hypothetical protein JTB14_002201 [Gonioctena quinquepunctata]|nr:hypothetical protein JTB14_002201 [Gonioctena quinquepunctata]